MADSRPWWRKRVKHRDAVALCVLSSSFLMAGELMVPVLQQVYLQYLEPVLGDPLLLTFRGLLVVFAFTTSLGAVLVLIGGWYFMQGRIPRGRFLVGFGVGLTSLSLANKLSFYTLAYGTPLAFLVPLATSLTGVGILFGFTAHLLMGRYGQIMRKRVISALRLWRQTQMEGVREGDQEPRATSWLRRKPTRANSAGAHLSVDGEDEPETEIL
jgi:hypothetical protein